MTTTQTETETTRSISSGQACQEERADLECRMGGSDKVYHVQLTQSEAGWAVHAQNGPRGGTLTNQKPKIKDAPYEDAKRIFDSWSRRNWWAKATVPTTATSGSQRPAPPKQIARP